MKNPNKLFTPEFITLCMLMLSLIVGGLTIITYTDRLPLWVILLLGFWYPVGVIIKVLYEKLKGRNGDSL